MKTTLLSPVLFFFLFMTSFSIRSAETGILRQPELPGQEPRNTLREGVAEISTADIRITLSFNAPPTEWVHVFLNTDGDDTGFTFTTGETQSPGWDFLIEGQLLYAFSGSTAAEWNWEKLDVPLTREIKGNQMRISFPSSALPPETVIRLMAATYTEQYAVTLDLLPRGKPSWTFRTPAASSRTPPDPLPVRNIDRRAAFDRIKSYACYYGTNQVDRLSKRDAVIIETRKQTPQSVATMQAADTLVIGYISIGEDDELRSGDTRGPGGYDSGYFDRDQDGNPDKNPTWNSYYADAREPAWRRHFLDKAYEMRMRYGVDGFFLDTVDTSEIYPKSKSAMISLIRELRNQNPESVIIINRGFHVVEPLGADIDGLMFESFTASWDWGKNDYILMRPSAWDWGLEVYRDILKPAIDEHGLKILALDYAGSGEADAVQIAFDRAATFGFVLEISNIYLDQIYDLSTTGTPNPKYLEIQTTPESLSYTLTEKRNGFPEGTVITPSSAYPDYEVAPVVDGVRNKDSLNWRNRAWASWEKDSPHYLEFTFPSPVTLRALEITWAVDNGKPHPSSQFRVEIKNAPDDAWTLLSSQKDNVLPKNNLAFDPVTVSAMRLIQPGQGGFELRPNLMWVESLVIDAE